MKTIYLSGLLAVCGVAMASPPELLLKCRTINVANQRFEAKVIGPRTITEFRELEKDEDKGELVVDHGDGPFKGMPFNARNPRWAHYYQYSGLTGAECVHATCTTLVLPNNLLRVVGKTFPSYAAQTTDQAGGSFPLVCSVIEN